MRRNGAAARASAGLATCLAGLALSGCGEATRIPAQADTGAQPQIVEPVRTLLPTVNIATAQGWPAGVMPVPAAGLNVALFAQDLQHPRWLAVLPNGDVLVAETNAPDRPEDQAGIKGWVMGLVMKRAGAGGPSPDRITLLRDSRGSGRADVRSTFLDAAQGLHSPFGMALVGETLYVANTDAVLAFAYRRGMTRITTPGRRIAELPAGPRNHHWTKSLVASPDGRKLYVGVGSNSNVAEHGLAAEQGRAAVLEIDLASGSQRVFASGLRNPVGLSFDGAGRLWAVVNERDELGSDLVPDYLSTVRDGAFYGWPHSYWGSHADPRAPPAPAGTPGATVPDYALGSHVAPLGLAWAADSPLAARLDAVDSGSGRAAAGVNVNANVDANASAAAAPATPGMFIGLHGSWNRKPRAGYKVVWVPFSRASGAAPAGLALNPAAPAGLPVDVLVGFVSEDGQALGRPVGVALDGRGGLLVADDVGNRIWRVVAAP